MKNLRARSNKRGYSKAVSRVDKKKKEYAAMKFVPGFGLTLLAGVLVGGGTGTHYQTS